MIPQLLVILGAAIFFAGGVLARQCFSHDRSVRIREVAAVLVAGFVLFAIPLCPSVYYALIQTNSDLMSVLPAMVPVFSAGFAARVTLLKLLS